MNVRTGNKHHRCIAAALALCIGGAMAAPPAEAPKLTDASFMAIDGMLVSAKGKPNEEFRLNGLKAYQSRQYDEAQRRFEMAASYADKYSQHYLSLMNWYGVGIPVDRVQAYIWSDLAAERGSKRLLVIREKMWSGLTAQEQAQVSERGQAFYERYGDEVAKPRAEAEIRRFARNMTGTRVGYRNQMLDTGGGPVNGSFQVDTGSNAAAYAISVSGSPDELYGKEGGLRALKTYWQEQDRMLDGSVEVGPMQPVRRGGRDGGLSS